MSEYYIGAICVNSNYLEHGRTKGVKNGEGKYVRWGVPTALGRAAGYKGYDIVRGRREAADNNPMAQRSSWNPQRNVRMPILSSTAQKTFPVTQPSRNQASLSRQTNRDLEKRAGSEGLSLLPQKERRDAPTNYQPMSEENYRTVRNRNRFVGADRAMSWTGNKNLVSDVATGVENIGVAVGNWGKQAVKDVGDWLAKAGDTVKQWLAPAANWVRIKWNKAMNFIKNSNFYKSAQKVVGNIRNWGKTTLYSIRDAASRVGSFVGGFIKGITGRRTGISNYQDSDREAGNAAGSQVRSFGTNIMNQVTGRQAEIDRKAGGAKTSSRSKESRNRNTVESRDMSPISTPQKRIRDRHRTTDRRK